MNILVIGGTGTLGRAIIAHYHAADHHKISCFSRDELKQQELKKQFPKVNCILGDIRGSCWPMIDFHIIYHVAALKHIDVLESNVIEALKTNVSGTIKMANYAMQKGVSRCAFSSTDKAVYPINVYGHTKALSEKYLLNLNSAQQVTRFSVFRWGNVLNSRGSVVGAFKKTLLEEGKIYLTHPEMTRFWICIDDAVKFLITNTENSIVRSKENILIPPMKSSKVSDLARVLAKKIGVKKFKTEITGIRPGEKIHEDIDSTTSSLSANKYTDDELSDLLEGCV